MDFTVKFFHPPQRTVPCNNGLLNTRTKHTVAQDRFIVAEQRLLNVEQRKSANNLHSIEFQQKQLEKRLSQKHQRSTSEANLLCIHRTNSYNETSEVNQSKFYSSLQNSNQNLLSLPIRDENHSSFSAYSVENLLENPVFISEIESNNYDEHHLKLVKTKNIQLPMVSIIPPE